jgi:succinate-semialdehyde dehydrogenase/glutarate-semialdehyde dehydrogenase
MTSSFPLEYLSTVPHDLLINGQWRPAAHNGHFTVEDPATEEKLSNVANATIEDALAALDAAARAQDAWAATAPQARGEILQRAFELLTTQAERYAVLITLEMGKPLGESRGEVAYAAEFFRWFAGEATRVHGENRREPGGAFRILTSRQPVGPSLLITPWNFPLAMATRKLGAALAAGCATILKPAEQTPLTALALAETLREAGVPPGVVNVITTTDAPSMSRALMDDRRLRKVSFTGSTEVGRILVRQSAHQLQRLSMELGGNAPFIVFADADLDAAVEGALVAKLRNGGESCVAANRFLVQRPLVTEFSSRLASVMAEYPLGSGITPGVRIGPLIDDGARNKISALVDDARARGARVLIGGERPSGPGYFYLPTVLSDVDPHAAILDQEIFGPVAPITTFDTDDEALRMANASDAGLVSFIYTENLRRAHYMIDSLDTGMVGVNRGVVSNAAAPFGGVKQSGFGREGGLEGIDEYLSVKYAAIN